MATKPAVHAPRKTIWLHPDANCNAFEHNIDDLNCPCEICKDKPRLIVVVN
jgi:hypothetical protein